MVEYRSHPRRGKRGVTVPRPYQVFKEVGMDDENWRNRQIQQQVDLGGDVMPGQAKFGGP